MRVCAYVWVFARTFAWCALLFTASPIAAQSRGHQFELSAGIAPVSAIASPATSLNAPYATAGIGLRRAFYWPITLGIAF